MKSKEEIEKRLLAECLDWVHEKTDRYDYHTQPIKGWIEALAWVLNQEAEIEKWFDNVDD